MFYQLNKAHNSRDGKYSFVILPVERCPRIEIVNWKVAFREVRKSLYR